jgi:Bax protein
MVATPAGRTLLWGDPAPAAATADAPRAEAAIAAPMPTGLHSPRSDRLPTVAVAATPPRRHADRAGSAAIGTAPHGPMVVTAAAEPRLAGRIGSAGIATRPHDPVMPVIAPVAQSLTLGGASFDIDVIVDPTAEAALAGWPMLPAFEGGGRADPAADVVVATTTADADRGGLPAMLTAPMLLALEAGSPVLDVLFAPPTALALPAAPIDKQSDLVVHVDTADKLIEVFDDEDFSWNAVREGSLDAVPRVFVSTFPDDIGEIETIDLRKRVFFDSLLPLVLAVNEEIQGERARLDALLADLEAGVPPTAADAAWLADLATRYEVADTDIDELRLRVDVVPPSMALAQAAVESGWGTSRLARRGNALFGQIVADASQGIPAADGDHGFAAFETLFDSAAAYAENLNTHFAYEEFRAARAEQRAAGAHPDGYTLMGELTAYSELGHEYIDYIRVVIRANDLQTFDRIRLRAPDDAEADTAFDGPSGIVPSMTDQEEAWRGPALRRLAAPGTPA